MSSFTVHNILAGTLRLVLWHIMATFSLCSSIGVRDLVSYPYITTGRIIVLYMLIFKFSDTGKETERSEVNGSKHYLNLICS